jgi:hypothetical protein
MRKVILSPYQTILTKHRDYIDKHTRRQNTELAQRIVRASTPVNSKQLICTPIRLQFKCSEKYVPLLEQYHVRQKDAVQVGRTASLDRFPDYRWLSQCDRVEN